MKISDDLIIEFDAILIRESAKLMINLKMNMGCRRRGRGMGYRMYRRHVLLINGPVMLKNEGAQKDHKPVQG